MAEPVAVSTEGLEFMDASMLEQLGGGAGDGGGMGEGLDQQMQVDGPFEDWSPIAQLDGTSDTEGLGVGAGGEEEGQELVDENAGQDAAGQDDQQQEQQQQMLLMQQDEDQQQSQDADPDTLHQVLDQEHLGVEGFEQHDDQLVAEGFEQQPMENAEHLGGEGFEQSLGDNQVPLGDGVEDNLAVEHQEGEGHYVADESAFIMQVCM